MENKCENCGKCCYATEMILSSQDIDLILQSNPSDMIKDDFVFKNKNGFFQLKNRNGCCVFLNPISKSCSIYKIRPQGCRFYPLIYDFYNRKCILDKDCPRTDLFYQNKEVRELICKRVMKFVKDELKLNSS